MSNKCVCACVRVCVCVCVSVSVCVCVFPRAVHLQYESFLQRDAQNQRTEYVTRVLSTNVAQWYWHEQPSHPQLLDPNWAMQNAGHLRKRYQQLVFQDCDAAQVTLFWAKLVCRMARDKPQFVTLDDDLPNSASPACLAQHRALFLRFMYHTWPVAAPWELTPQVEQLLHVYTAGDLSALHTDPALLAVLKMGQIGCNCDSYESIRAGFPSYDQQRTTWLC